MNRGARFNEMKVPGRGAALVNYLSNAMNKFTPQPKPRGRRAGRAAGDLASGVDIDALTGLVTTTLYGMAIRARCASRASLRKTVDPQASHR